MLPFRSNLFVSTAIFGCSVGPEWKMISRYVSSIHGADQRVSLHRTEVPSGEWRQVFNCGAIVTKRDTQAVTTLLMHQRCSKAYGSTLEKVSKLFSHSKLFRFEVTKPTRYILHSKWKRMSESDSFCPTCQNCLQWLNVAKKWIRHSFVIQYSSFISLFALLYIAFSRVHIDHDSMTIIFLMDYKP